MAVDVAFRIGVDLDRHPLSRPHVVELAFLKVRPNPNVVRHKHRQVCARLREFTDCGAELDDTPRLVGVTIVCERSSCAWSR